MTEQELLLDCLRRLNQLGIAYMLTGSMASNAWGIPRTTHDLDFVVQLPPSQTGALAKAFGVDYFVDEPAIHAAYSSPYQFNILHIPSALKIDFWMLRPLPFEQEMFRRRQRINVLGEFAWLATPEDVILHKLHWHRLTPSERQLGDVAGIVAVQQGRLDEGYLHQWAREIDVSDLVTDALAGKLPLKST
ncbi:MAG TPA: hypothetical protein P5186_20900 [Candidatus Paceibacterota bacterium]|nr:hypothetical protein [Verrucomicrobiota bacterium]HRY50517.1 hypothetical protein [Candidatus Paceibacterota bacterium]HSA01657.1 hypothetical protein [Candidatus Paceibacterota bacterium]